MLPSLDQPVSALSAFVDHLQHWSDRLAPLPLPELLAESGDPGNVGIFVVDTINGFYHEGALQSDRLQATIQPILDLLIRSHAAGVRHFVFAADEHRADAQEFTEFPVHCVRGTAEADLIPEILRLPFAPEFTVVRKPTISPAIGTTLDRWLAAHDEVTHRIVVGYGTDLGVYQMAMHLKLTANARNLDLPVIVCGDCVDTYDVPADMARDFGIPAHPGDVFHAFFLHHMFLNGIRIVSNIA